MSSNLNVKSLNVAPRRWSDVVISWLVWSVREKKYCFFPPIFWLGQVTSVWCLDEVMNLQLRFGLLDFPVGVLTQAKASEGRQSEATGHMLLI